MNIVLTGFMASGKTEISKAIASRSRFKLIDTDDMVSESEGMSINDIFSQKGEEYFRKAEYKCVCRAAAMDNMVIATGGGVPLNKNNMTELRKNGIIFNLAPDFEVIEARLENASAARPLLRKGGVEDIKKRFYDRLPYYADCDFKIHVIKGRSPESYAEEILNTVTNRKKED